MKKPVGADVHKEFTLLTKRKNYSRKLAEKKMYSHGAEEIQDVFQKENSLHTGFIHTIENYSLYSCSQLLLHHIAYYVCRGLMSGFRFGKYVICCSGVYCYRTG